MTKAQHENNPDMVILLRCYSRINYTKYRCAFSELLLLLLKYLLIGDVANKSVLRLPYRPSLRPSVRLLCKYYI